MFIWYVGAASSMKESDATSPCSWYISFVCKATSMLKTPADSVNSHAYDTGNHAVTWRLYSKGSAGMVCNSFNSWMLMFWKLKTKPKVGYLSMNSSCKFSLSSPALRRNVSAMSLMYGRYSAAMSACSSSASVGIFAGKEPCVSCMYAKSFSVSRLYTTFIDPDTVLSTFTSAVVSKLVHAERSSVKTLRVTTATIR